MFGLAREERELDEQLPSFRKHEDPASIEEPSTRAYAIPYISLCEVIVTSCTCHHCGTYWFDCAS